MEALRALLDPDLFLASLLASLLAAGACGLTGPLVVSRRLVFLAGAIAHVAIGGVGAAIFFRERWGLSWLQPVHGGLAAALVGAALIAVLQQVGRERRDTAIGAVWAVGMAIGLILAKLAGGYHELTSYLFGYLTAATWGDVRLLAVLVAALVVILLATWKRVVANGLDPEQVRLQGLNVMVDDLVLLVVIALTVVALTQVVGLLLVIALLTLPAAAAGRLTRRLAPMIAIAIAGNVVLVVVPRLLVYGSSVPPEPASVVAAAILYLGVLGFGRRWRRPPGRGTGKVVHQPSGVGAGGGAA
jgi:zinc transport system permease protein